MYYYILETETGILRSHTNSRFNNAQGLGGFAFVNTALKTTPEHTNSLLYAYTTAIQHHTAGLAPFSLCFLNKIARKPNIM